MNATRFEHTSHWGTRFLSETADFRNGVTIQKPAEIALQHFVADVSEMVGFHATNIHPLLNGFQGYDAVDYTIVVARQ